MKKTTKQTNNRGYIVRLTQKDTQKGSVQIFYMGVDGYIHTDTLFVEPYKRKGNALNLIKKETETSKWGDIVRVSKNSCFESKRWLNTYEVIPA